MKASILVFSQTGNTLKAGTAIAKGLRLGGVEVDQVNFLHRHRWNPDHADLIGIGCPVFENRPAEVVPNYLAEKKFNFSGKKAFVFITSGGSPAKSLWHLSQAVARTGATVIGGMQFRGATSFPTLFGLFPGRPNETDLNQAEKFGRAIAADGLKAAPLPACFQIDLDLGGVFYDNVGPIMNYIKKKATPLPVCDSGKCHLCGTCIYECPSGSITIENQKVRFHDTCIVCYRCWHVCPRAAISIQFSPGNGFLERWLYSEKMERWLGDIKPDEWVGPNRYKDVLAHRIRLKYDRRNPTSEYLVVSKKVR